VVCRGIAYLSEHLELLALVWGLTPLQVRKIFSSTFLCMLWRSWARVISFGDCREHVGGSLSFLKVSTSAPFLLCSSRLARLPVELIGTLSGRKSSVSDLFRHFLHTFRTLPPPVNKIWKLAAKYPRLDQIFSSLCGVLRSRYRFIPCVPNVSMGADLLCVY